MEISVGTILEGAVKSITNFGAFVTLPGGRSGLVHISEIAHTYVSDVRDHLTEGQEVKVKVVGIDDAGRINLSIKKAVPPPPRAQNAPPRKRPARPDVRENDSSRGRSREPRGSSAPQPSGPPDFEARLKQFMQLSDSKLSDLRMSEKRSSRRSGHH